MTETDEEARRRPAGPPAGKARGSRGGIGRTSSPAAERVSDDLRRMTSGLLRRRRRVVGLTLLASGAMGAVTAYQTGLLRHLPEPPLWVFDADRVDASGEAYQLFKAPDATLGLLSYAATLVLAGMGSARRAEERPWIPLLLAAKVAADAAGGGYLTLEQVTKHRRLCFWCLTAAAASMATVPQVVAEARLSLRQLAQR